MRDLEQVINEGNAIIEAKDNQIQLFKDQNNDYLTKIMRDKKELTRLRNEVNSDNNIIGKLQDRINELTIENNHVKKVCIFFAILYFLCVLAVILKALI